jgi:hypothetical protein
MALSYSGRLNRDVFVRTAQLVSSLVARPEVEATWTRESSCAGMTVGGLARHLVEQSLYVAEYLPVTPPEDAPRISVLEHYAMSDWAQEGPDGPSNLDIRDQWNAGGANDGPAETARLQSEVVDRLAGVLGAAGDWMYLPWHHVVMPADDFVVTRMMESVVHADDLATSVGLPTPDFGPDVLEPVLGLLAALAVEQHGQDAVVRTLTRPQRAPESIAVFGGPS